MSGLTQQIIAAPGSGSTLGSVRDHLFGSLAATSLTIAMLIFFVSGELYFRAWRPEHEPDTALLRRADLVSGLGALALLVALALYGNAWLALASTTLLAVAKFGSAAMHNATWTMAPLGKARFDPLRGAVVLSRVPAVLALAVAVVPAASADAHSMGSIAPQIVLLLCYGLWIKADLLLMRAR